MWQRFLRAGSFSQTIILEPCLGRGEGEAQGTATNMKSQAGQRLGDGQAKGWARVWTVGTGWSGGGGQERGQGSGLECRRWVYSQHSHIEGVGDVGRGGQMPAAIEALGVRVGAAAEHRLPWWHCGEKAA